MINNITGLLNQDKNKNAAFKIKTSAMLFNLKGKSSDL